MSQDTSEQEASDPTHPLTDGSFAQLLALYRSRVYEEYHLLLVSEPVESSLLQEFCS